jgi:iron complex outermembrane receptor protein
MRTIGLKTATSVLLLLLSGALSAQVVIKGLITNELNQPLKGATIKLGKQNTFSDSSGHYLFSNIRPGQHIITSSHVGFEPVSLPASVIAGDTEKVIDITMVSTATALQAVEITGRKGKGYVNTLTFAGSKTATAIKDVPQSIQYVTKEVMQDQGAVTHWVGGYDSSRLYPGAPRNWLTSISYAF